MNKKISLLLIKKLLDEVTPQEQMEIDNYAAQSDSNRRMVENYTKKKHVLEEVKLSEQISNEKEWKTIEKRLPGKVVRMNVYKGVAAIVVGIFICAWLFNYKSSKKEETHVKEVNRSSTFHHAILTLSNGQVINLHDLEDGFLDNDRLLTKNDSQLIYPLNYQPKLLGINMLETPKGNSYSLRLPDGSIAWLNSGSSIKYPNGFTGKYRTVVIQGEVYFEVAKNPSMPFIVQVQGMEIEVKGTKFAVNAYKESPAIRTTLVEGSVKVKGEGYADSLQPGEQAILTKDRKYHKIKVNDPEKRLQGWKENKFVWSGTDLRTILDDLSNWYGYTVAYPADAPSRGYSFDIERSEQLNTIFDVLQSGTGLQFRLENKTIIVSR